jgi:hypothetical protein
MKQFLLLFVISSCVGADLGSSYRSGQSYAANNVQDVKDAARHVDKANIPGYTEGMPPVANLQAYNLGDAALTEVANNEGGVFVKETTSTRGTYVIDPNHDPLVVAANQAIKDPLKTIHEEVDVITEEDEQKDTYEACDEGKSEVLRTCSKVLHVSVTIIPEKKRIEKSCPGHKKKNWCGGTRWCEPRECQSREIIEQHRQEIVNEHWVDGCQTLEAAVDEGTCSYESMRNGPPETRNISGKSITRNPFEKHYTYRCFKKTDDRCEQLRERGCVQVDSECKEMEGQHCLVWTQTYRCRANPISWQFFRSRGSIFCLGGDCHGVNYGPNSEFLEAITHLSIFKEAQADIRANIGIFAGKNRHCTRNCLNFRDCCGNGKGWGVSLHLAECSKDELELGELRKARKCVHIGTFCAESLPIIGCSRKKTTFCCFGTKLSRLIQEQARAQLGMGWGTPQQPACEGLTPEQLSQLDFSQMDLSELYAEIENTMKTKTKADVAPIAERLQRNVANMTLKQSQDNAVAERRPM